MAKEPEQAKVEEEDHDHDQYEAVDDDGHTLEDITPMEIDEDDDDETAENAEDDPEEYANWDSSLLGTMADYATENPEDEPQCCSEDDDDFEPGE